MAQPHEIMRCDASDAIKGLADLEQKIAKKFVRQALRAGAKITLGVAQSTAPQQSGTLARNVKLRSAGMRKGVIKMNVGIGAKWFTGPAFYGAFVAFGHRIGNRKLGDSRRLLPGNDWLTKAYESTRQQAVQVFGETIGTLIESNQ